MQLLEAITAKRKEEEAAAAELERQRREKRLAAQVGASAAAELLVGQAHVLWRMVICVQVMHAAGHAPRALLMQPHAHCGVLLRAPMCRTRPRRCGASR